MNCFILKYVLQVTDLETAVPAAYHFLGSVTSFETCWSMTEHLCVQHFLSFGDSCH